MNHELSQREHAHWANELLKACGGLDEAARVSPTSKSHLSKCASPHYAETMPARTIAVLENYCGKPIYSAAMAKCIQAPVATADLKDLACDFAEKAMILQAVIRQAVADGEITPRELSDIAAIEAEVGRALEELQVARREAETKPAPSKR